MHVHYMHFRKERKLHIVWLPKVEVRNVQFRELYTLLCLSQIKLIINNTLVLNENQLVGLDV
jgi:hypothetical protein